MKKILLALTISILTFSLIQAQETDANIFKNNTQGNQHTNTNKDTHPDIYVDGVKFDFPIQIIDPKKMESVKVIKGDEAIEKYNAPNGVIIIKTNIDEDQKIKINASRSFVSDKAPVMIIDGKISDRDNITPEDIESITVSKDEETLKKYDSPGGVIFITTKKGKKEKK